MNATRRKTVAAIIATLNSLKIESLDKVEDALGDIKSQIEDVCSEEEEAFDNVPDCFQDTSKTENMIECIDIFYLALECLEEISDSETIEEADEHIQEAASALEEILI